MDPHFITFAGVRFSYHDVGWHTLYEKGGIRIEAEHAGWYANGGSAAVNKAYKVTRDGSVGNSSVVTLYEGGSRLLLSPGYRFLGYRNCSRHKK